jgi:hypothetical protein
MKILTHKTEIQAFLKQLARDGVKEADEVRRRVEALPAKVARALCVLAFQQAKYQGIEPLNDLAVLRGIALAMGIDKAQLQKKRSFEFLGTASISKDELRAKIQQAYGAQHATLEAARRQYQAQALRFAATSS